MKTRWIAALLALLMVAALATTVSAGPYETSALGAYSVDDTLYAFAWLPDYEDSRALPKLGLMAGFSQVAEPIEAERLCDREEPGDIVLLVDNSTSMGKYVPQLLALTDGLFAEAKNIRITLATFGVDFTVQAEDLTTAGEVAEAVRALRCDEQGTDICGGAARAVAYCANELWQPGGIAQIILCTDGEPFYSRNAVTQEESEAAAAEQLALLLDDNPEVYVHLVCLDSWEPGTYQALKHGDGMDLMAADETAARYGGGLIAGWYNGLFAAAYPKQSQTEDLALRTQDNEIISIPRCGKISAEQPVDPGIFDELPAVVDPESDEPAPSLTPIETTEPAESEPEPIDPSSLADLLPTAPPEESSEETIPSSAAEAAPLPAPEETPSLFGQLWFWAAVGGGILLLAGLIVLLILLGKRKTKPQTARQPAPNAIPLQLRILSGSLQGQSRQLWLQEHLMLGSDARCDLVLTDPGVAPIHARIYRQDGALMVEDLNSAAGTALGGMRLYMPNLLRPGDQLALGSTVISVQF